MPAHGCEKCGKRLNRYNRTGLCGPCRLAGADQPAPSWPTAVPVGVWALPDVRAALERLDMPALFSRLRAHTGMKQADLAFLAGRTQADWSKIETGRRVADVNVIVSILSGLGAPAGKVRLPLPDAHGAALQQSAVQQAAVDSADFVSGLAPTSVTDVVLDEFTFELSRIATAYVHAPLWPLFLDLVKIRDELFGLLQVRQRHWHMRRLFLLAGVTCLLMAHASQNLGDEKAAHSQIKTALVCADEAGHEGLRAWGRGTSALIAEWSPQRHLALRLTADAHEYAPAGEGRIRIAAIEARTAARMGDTARAHAALDRMREAQEYADRDDGLGTDFGGLLTFPGAKQAYYAGGTYALLGEHEKALDNAMRAIRQYETGLPEDRSYGDEALARLDVVTAHLALGNLDGAGHHLMSVLAIPPEQRISQLGAGLRRVLFALQEPTVATSAGVGDLVEATRRFQQTLTPGTVPSVP